MYAERQSIALTTDGSGDCTAYSSVITGRILTVAYVKTDFTNGVDFTITLENTGEAVLTLTDQNSSAVFYPRVPVDDETGADATLDGTRKMRDCVVAAGDRLKIVVASGGATKTGVIKLVVG